MEHLVSPTDPVALKTLNPGFASLFVAGPTTLAGPTTSLRQVTVIAAAAGSSTLTTSQSGIIRIIPNSVAMTLTLPTVASAVGLTFEFFWTGAADGTHPTVITAQDATTLAGNIFNMFGAAGPVINPLRVASNTSITRVAGNTLTSFGDRLKFTSDGSAWWVEGAGGGSAAGATFTAT